MPARSTADRYLAPGSRLKDRFIPDLRKLKQVVRQLQKEGHRVVLTQGVYDMIHEGHARYLEKARSFGDILVVGVDSDELTRKRKGPNRPIVQQKERLQMLSHLHSVGILTIREARHDIGTLIRTIRPDVLVVSESTREFQNKEAQQYRSYCKEIICLPPQAATSTTARVRLLTISGADQLAKEIIKGVPELVINALNRLRNQ